MLEKKKKKQIKGDANNSPLLYTYFQVIFSCNNAK